MNSKPGIEIPLLSAAAPRTVRGVTLSEGYHLWEKLSAAGKGIPSTELSSTGPSNGCPVGASCVCIGKLQTG